jgi:ABC-type antimicrobial peptide transport system permease subunit
MYSGGCSTCPPATVIGVVGDVLYQGLAGDGVAVYAPIEQELPRTLSLIVRSTGEAHVTIRALRAAISGLDPELAPVDIIMTERLGAALGDPRRWAAVVGAFAGAGALLAALGIFGLMSYVVRQRRREIGVRIALGATPNSLTWLVLKRGMGYALLGTAIGLGISGFESRWLGALLFGVGAGDPATIAIAVVLLLSIAAVACLLPGLRAARIRPVEALSSD